MKRTHRGFTLLELMIVVVVIAIIASIAVPSYSRYVMRTRRADAKEMLMRVAAAQERHFTNFNKYGKLKADLGFSDDTAPSEKGFYAVTVVVSATGDKYTLSAAPQGVQATDACATLTLDSTGVKSPTDAAHATNGPCW